MTIPNIIIRAEISQYLAVLAIKRGGTFGKGIVANLPLLLYEVRKNVSRTYDLDPTNTTLIKTSNYLYALCGMFGLQADYLQSTGGIVPNPSGRTLYGYPIQGIYTAATDGEYSLDLGLPAGAKVVWAEKSILPLNPADWVWTAPNLILLNGVSLSADEMINYMYVLPIN